jgi:hypothetical protein
MIAVLLGLHVEVSDSLAVNKYRTALTTLPHEDVDKSPENGNFHFTDGAKRTFRIVENLFHWNIGVH